MPRAPPDCEKTTTSENHKLPMNIPVKKSRKGSPRDKPRKGASNAGQLPTVPNAPESTTPFHVGHFAVRECPGTDPTTGAPCGRHDKPFLGVANVARKNYCEIKATIQQLGVQNGFVGSALYDDE